MAPKWPFDVPKTGFLISRKNGLAFLGDATAVHTKMCMSLFRQFLFGKKTWLDSTTFFQWIVDCGVGGVIIRHLHRRSNQKWSTNRDMCHRLFSAFWRSHAQLKMQILCKERISSPIFRFDLQMN
jgi:hypothetical protein